jgi:hypothetical protein
MNVRLGGAPIQRGWEAPSIRSDGVDRGAPEEVLTQQPGSRGQRSSVRECLPRAMTADMSVHLRPPG